MFSRCGFFFCGRVICRAISISSDVFRISSMLFSNQKIRSCLTKKFRRAPLARITGTLKGAYHV